MRWNSNHSSHWLLLCSEKLTKLSGEVNGQETIEKNILLLITKTHYSIIIIKKYGISGARVDKQVNQTQQRSEEWLLLLGFKNQIISAIAGERNRKA